MRIYRGKLHDYLGMDLDYLAQGGGIIYIEKHAAKTIIALWRLFLYWPPASSFFLAPPSPHASDLSSRPCLPCVRMPYGLRSWGRCLLVENLSVPHWTHWRCCMHSPLTSGVPVYLSCHYWRYELGFSGSWSWSPSPPNSTGGNFSLRDSSMGPIRVPTPGTVLCRYFHSSCNNIPKPA